MLALRTCASGALDSHSLQTNHLDINGIRWLEEFLTSDVCADMTILFVSHDRTFINNVATHTVLLAGKRLHYFPGNFDAFEATRLEKLQQGQCKAENDAKKKAHLENQLAHARKQAKDSKRGGQGKAVGAIKTKLERVGQFTNVRDFSQSWRTVWGACSCKC